jgi:hypothetical protein
LEHIALVLLQAGQVAMDAALHNPILTLLVALQMQVAHLQVKVYALTPKKGKKK